MRKRFIAFCFLFLFLTSFVFATDNSGVEEGLESFTEDLEDKKDIVDDFQRATAEDRWNSLNEQWAEFLLKNEFISAMDTLLQALNPVFLVLLDKDYSLTVEFFVILIFWIFLVVLAYDYLSVNDNPYVKWILPFASVIILAHLRIIQFIFDLTIRLVFFREGVWGWISFVFVIIFYVVLFKLAKLGANNLKKDKNQEEVEEMTHRVNVLEEERRARSQ